MEFHESWKFGVNSIYRSISNTQTNPRGHSDIFLGKRVGKFCLKYLFLFPNKMHKLLNPKTDSSEPKTSTGELTGFYGIF